MTQPLQLIGLTGRTNAGKDTCAGFLLAHGFQAMAFADDLRREICEAWRIDPRLLTERVTKEVPLPALATGMCQDIDFLRWAVDHELDMYAPRSPRFTLQRWGTEYRRGGDADYWVRKVHAKIRTAAGTGRRQIVVTDVRMLNEAVLIRQLGGHLVEVVRPDLTLGMPPETAAHLSEDRSWAVPELTVNNDGGLEGLRNECAFIVNKLFNAEEIAR